MGSTLLTIALAALAQAAVAQDKPAKEAPKPPGRRRRPRTTPRHTIRVLQNPYDLASFYRSGGSAPGGGRGWRPIPRTRSRASTAGRQPRGRPTAGRDSGRTATARRRPAPFPGYRRSIGQNGDLFLVVPFLAPVGPISSAFFGY